MNQHTPIWSIQGPIIWICFQHKFSSLACSSDGCSLPNSELLRRGKEIDLTGEPHELNRTPCHFLLGIELEHMIVVHQLYTDGDDMSVCLLNPTLIYWIRNMLEWVHQLSSQSLQRLRSMGLLDGDLKGSHNTHFLHRCIDTQSSSQNAGFGCDSK